MQGGMGPCGMMDRTGLGVVYHVGKLIGETTPNNIEANEYARYLDERLIQQGRLGVATVAEASTATRTQPSPSQASSDQLRKCSPPRRRHRWTPTLPKIMKSDPASRNGRRLFTARPESGP